MMNSLEPLRSTPPSGLEEMNYSEYDNTCSFLTMAQMYYRAGLSCIYSDVLKVSPAFIYIMHHVIELSLKAILLHKTNTIAKTHDIKKLYDCLPNLIKDYFGDLGIFINNFANNDIQNQASRFPNEFKIVEEECDGKKVVDCNKSILPIMYVDVNSIIKNVGKIINIAKTYVSK